MNQTNFNREKRQHSQRTRSRIPIRYTVPLIRLCTVRTIVSISLHQVGLGFSLKKKKKNKTQY